MVSDKEAVPCDAGDLADAPILSNSRDGGAQLLLGDDSGDGDCQRLADAGHEQAACMMNPGISSNDCLRPTLSDLASALHGLESVAEALEERIAGSTASPCTSHDEQPGTSSRSLEAALTDELQSRLTALELEKSRVEHDRDDLSRQQGQYKGLIAKLEGSVAASERRVQAQAAELGVLKLRCSDLELQLSSARQQLDLTPDRCRVGQRALADELAAMRNQAAAGEAQLAKLKHLVDLEVLERNELALFAEAEREALLEHQAELTRQLVQAGERADAASAQLEAARQRTAALEAQLEAAQTELLSEHERSVELDVLATQQGGLLTQLSERCSALEAERAATAASLCGVQGELSSVSEHSTRMFRQVRFLSHMLDKHASHLSKLPELGHLIRDLRAFVADNARHWDAAGAVKGGAGGEAQTQHVAHRSDVPHSGGHTSAASSVTTAALRAAAADTATLRDAPHSTWQGGLSCSQPPALP